MTDSRLAIRRQLSRTGTVYLASFLSLVLGLFFLFVWSPHPWGWLGFDHYHELGLTLAKGGEFPTTDVPWGYAYILAAFYRLFGERLWVPLLAQVLANAAMPVLLYALVRPLTSQQTAVLAALLTGLLSFNTVYATTQSSDAVCTVLFMIAMLAFARGWQSGHIWLFAASGLLSGLAPQFRPNLILFPFLLSAAFVAIQPGRRHLTRAAVYLSLVVVALAPWTIRNFRLTGEFLPTSTHGGVQLWYGTLQTGKYFNSRAYNPRSIFEAPPFDYTSTTRRPVIVTAHRAPCSASLPAEIALVYWTDRAPVSQRVAPFDNAAGSPAFTIPAQTAPTTIYYYVETTEATRVALTPRGGDRNPGVFFVATNHLGDLDTHGDLLDVFDVIRLMRLAAWDEPPAFSEKLDLDRDGRLTEGDLRAAVDRLLRSSSGGAVRSALTAVERTDAHVIARFTDGSTLQVDREWHGLVTDLAIEGQLAGVLEYARVPFTEIEREGRPGPPDAPCEVVERVSINDAFYLREPHQMRRYTALAFDNIRRDPMGFLVATLGRMAQLFIVRGSNDPWTAHQFTASGLLYTAGFVLTSACFLALLAGAWLAWRQRQHALLLLLLPIVYLPLTIGFVLTNMRYTVTVQPFVFVFVAVALMRLLRQEE